MSLGEIRTELSEAVHAAASILNVYSFEHPEPQLPAAIVTWANTISFQGGTADGALRFELVVRFIVPGNDPALSSQAVTDLIASDIPRAIREHPAVSWKSANPTGISPPEPGAGSTVVVDLTIDIHAKISPTP